MFTRRTALETHRKANPETADERFLLGYHYLTCGHNDRWRNSKATELQPKDEVPGKPREVIDSASSGSNGESRYATGGYAVACAVDKIAGSWKVRQIQLKLQHDIEQGRAIHRASSAAARMK
jgi:hypothetical protein